MDYFATDNFIEPSRGDLLISEPYLPDPNFERTVILLCEHDHNGSFGFVLNKPTQNVLSELIKDVPQVKSPVFVGGPVQQNTLHFLHRSELVLDGDREVGKGIYWGIDFEGLMGMVDSFQISLEDVRFFIGYSGWSPGQLVDELKAKSWIVYKKASSDLVFDVPSDNLWKQVLENMGGKYRVISNYPIDPRLN